MTQLAICGDCDADVTITEVGPDLFTAEVLHDDTCPWYRAFLVAARARREQMWVYRKDGP